MILALVNNAVTTAHARFLFVFAAVFSLRIIYVFFSTIYLPNQIAWSYAYPVYLSLTYGIARSYTHSVLPFE